MVGQRSRKFVDKRKWVDLQWLWAENVNNVRCEINILGTKKENIERKINEL